MADMNCLNNEDELVSQLDSESQIDSELDSEAELAGVMENVVEVSPRFEGLETEDIIVTVDNVARQISADFQPAVKQNIADNTQAIQQLSTDKADKTEIPTSVSQLENDSKYATEEYVNTNGGKIDKILVNNVEQAISNKSVNISIPTQLSELSNDVGLIDNTVNNLVNYYSKSETYTKTEVLDLVSRIPAMGIQIVSTLPTENISETTIYLLKVEDSKENNEYEEYLYANGKWELIGTTTFDFDLSNYYTKSEVDTIVQEAVGSVEIPDNLVTTDTAQEITGTKTFNSLQVKKDNIVPVYEQQEQSFTYTYNYEEIPDSGAYPFVLGDDGFYESTNKGIDNSYAMCKVSFTFPSAQNLFVEFIHYAQDTADYSVFGNIDTYLSYAPNIDEDADKIAIQVGSAPFNRPESYTINFGELPAGEHFFVVKYIKDGFGSENNDSLKIRVKEPVGTVTELVDVLVGYAPAVVSVDVDGDQDVTLNGNKALTEANASNVLDSKYVSLVGDQSISGLKSFENLQVYGQIASENLSITTDELINSAWQTNNNTSQIAVLQNNVQNHSNEISNINGEISGLSRVAKTGKYEDLVEQLKPASQDNLGAVRTWIDEEGYLCISTIYPENIYSLDSGVKLVSTGANLTLDGNNLILGE